MNIEKYYYSRENRPAQHVWAPFSYELLERRKNFNGSETIVIWVGPNSRSGMNDENGKGFDSRPKLVVPAGEPPEKFKYPVGDLDCLICWCGNLDEIYALRVARMLISFGASSVTLASDGGDLVFYRKRK